MKWDCRQKNKEQRLKKVGKRKEKKSHDKIIKRKRKLFFLVESSSEREAREAAKTQPHKERESEKDIFSSVTSSIFFYFVTCLTERSIKSVSVRKHLTNSLKKRKN